MSSNYYKAFGLNIRSAIPLPELAPTGHGKDVTIRLGRSQEWPSFHKRFGQKSKETVPPRPFFLTSAGNHFFILDGRKIIVDAHFPLEDRHLGFYVLERVLIALLYQRGVSVFHGSTVSINGTAVSLMGAPFSGKTAITFALCNLGHPIVDDDILALSMTGATPSVLPGYPMIKLWPDLVEYFDISPEEVHSQFSGQEKRVYPVAADFSSEPLPLGAIYILEERDFVRIDRLPAGKAVKELMACWYGLLHGELFHMAGGYSQAFQQSVYLTKTTKVSRLCRPRDLSCVPELRQMIEEDSR